MNSIFVRIYGGMLASMIVVGFISYWLIVQSNTHFNTAYHEAILKGSMRLVAEGMARYQGQQRADWLDFCRQKLDLNLQLKSVISADWPQRLIADVKSHQTLINRSLGNKTLQVYAWIPTSEALIVYAELSQFSEQQVYGSVQLILKALQAHPVVEWESLLANLQTIFGFALQRSDPAVVNLSATQRQQLRDGHTVLQFNNNAENLSTLQVVAAIPDEQDLLVMGPVNLFDFLPFHLFIVCGVVAIIVMGFTSYVLVRPLLVRLKRLEETAVKIRRDDLSARVTVDSHDALGRLASTFNDMAEHIQRLISSQREMTNAVSHELRTPVARLRFGLEIVGDCDNTEQRLQHLEGIDGDIQELETLIDEILTYASLEEGTPSLNMQMVEIDAILSQVKKETDQLGRGVTIEHVPSTEVGDLRFAECEERYIHRITQNLVGNATRYAASQVRISSACEGGMYRIDVEDDGPGIPPEQWEKVFLAFARLDDSRTRASGGYGLGLSIVERIAYWHGGVANVNRSSLGGAKFTVIWPRKQSLRKTMTENLSGQQHKKRFWQTKSSFA